MPAHARKRLSETIKTIQVISKRGKRDGLHRNLEQAGLQIRQRVPLDGNCLFTAICDQLKHLKLHRWRHLELRANIVDHMKRNPIIVSV